MAIVRLRKAWPGIPAGTALTQQADGTWTDALFRVRVTDRAVNESPDLDLCDPLVAGTTTYWYINDTGQVLSATYQDLPVHNARKAFGNMFRLQTAAQQVRNRFAQALAEIHPGLDY